MKEFNFSIWLLKKHILRIEKEIKQLQNFKNREEAIKRNIRDIKDIETTINFLKKSI